jgi:protein-tyrosine phosphatase
VSVDRIPLPSVDGSLWLCAKTDVGPDPELALERAGGASTVVCLIPERELDRQFAGYVGWLRRHQPDRALWFPIRNFGAESAHATMPFLQMVVDRIEQGEGVLMHCAFGQGRAGTMAVCLLMMLGATRDDALETVARHRVHAGPQDASQWSLVDDVARELGAA